VCEPGFQLGLIAGAEGEFHSQDLGAHGGLLNTIGHVSDGFADAAVFGHVIKKLDVVDVLGGTKVRHHRFYQ
jgi:hypothetical protein